MQTLLDNLFTFPVAVLRQLKFPNFSDFHTPFKVVSRNYQHINDDDFNRDLVVVALYLPTPEIISEMSQLLLHSPLILKSTTILIRSERKQFWWYNRQLFRDSLDDEKSLIENERGKDLENET